MEVEGESLRGLSMCMRRRKSGPHEWYVYGGVSTELENPRAGGCLSERPSIHICQCSV